MMMNEDNKQWLHDLVDEEKIQFPFLHPRVMIMDLHRDLLHPDCQKNGIVMGALDLHWNDKEDINWSIRASQCHYLVSGGRGGSHPPVVVFINDFPKNGMVLVCCWDYGRSVEQGQQGQKRWTIHIDSRGNYVEPIQTVQQARHLWMSEKRDHYVHVDLDPIIRDHNFSITYGRQGETDAFLTMKELSEKNEDNLPDRRSKRYKRTKWSPEDNWTAGTSYALEA